MQKQVITTIHNKGHARLAITRFLLLFCPVALIFIVGSFQLFRSELLADQIRVKSSEASTIQVGIKTIGRELKATINDLSYLASHEELARLISTEKRTKNSATHLQRDWQLFSQTRQFYDQIRWIDIDGQEQLRIDLVNGEAISILADKLQNKANRYYFTNTLKLNKNELFISPLDLNLEHGKIEQPLKPVIRFGTPIFDQQGGKQGIVLTNYLGQRLLDEFENSSRQVNSNQWLVNSDGFWLKGPSHEYEWGFMYQRPKRSMATQYPKAWLQFKLFEKGQFEDDDGLWTFATIYPLDNGLKGSSPPSMLQKTNPHNYAWKAISFLPKERYYTHAKSIGTKLVIATTAILIALFMGCLWLTKSWLTVKIVNENLEELVLKRTQSLNKSVEQAKLLARTDPLTAMNNRRAFFDYGNQIHEQSERYNHTYTAIIVDLDYFKNINDQYGHHAGDIALKETARVISEITRTSDLTGRVGGEEFAIIIPESTAKTAKDLAERLRKSISNLKIPLNDEIITFSASLGISERSHTDKALTEVLQKADKALYQAKEQGRNQSVIFEP